MTAPVCMGLVRRGAPRSQNAAEEIFGRLSLRAAAVFLVLCLALLATSADLRAAPKLERIEFVAAILVTVLLMVWSIPDLPFKYGEAEPMPKL